MSHDPMIVAHFFKFSNWIYLLYYVKNRKKI